MPWPDSLFEGNPFERAHSLAVDLTVRTGGLAGCFVEPVNAVRLTKLLQGLCGEGIPHRILGGGANVLVADSGIEDVVVSTRRAKHLAWEDERHLVAGAGLSLPWLVNTCRERGISGLEPLAGIPGTVGGAVRMNAGGRFGSIGSLARQMTVVSAEGEIQVREVDEDMFGYREARLKGAVVIDVMLELARGDRDQIRRAMREVLIAKARSQPLSARSTGCFFRNSPSGPAGRLIDQAGLKGKRCGGAMISKKHANFIVNEGEARTADILELARSARASVQERFGVPLVPEVDIWGATL